MSGTSELVKPLADAGVASNVIRILEEQRIDGADAINDLDANDWVRLYELGIKVGDKAAIQQVARKLREPTKFLVAPASLKFNLLAYAIGIVWAAPGVAIGAINTFGPFPADRELDTVGSSLLLVVLPGALYQVFATIVIESFRTYFSTDVLQQRSVGISLREAQRSNLANMAIVAALLLTVIIAMVQADSPLEGTGSNAALLAQYYMLFLVTSMVPLFGAIVMSSLLLLYIEPLDDSAAIAFIGPFMDYFGEPIISVLVGVFNFVPALSLWIYGAYGFGAGLLASLSTVLLMRKVCLTQLYLAAWENPELDSEVRKQRHGEVALDTQNACCERLFTCVMCCPTKT